MVCMCGAEAYVSGFDLVEQMRGECGQETTEIDVVIFHRAASLLGNRTQLRHDQQRLQGEQREQIILRMHRLNSP